MRRTVIGCVTIGFSICLGYLGYVLSTQANEPAFAFTTSVEPKPIDVNMHDFMEGVFQAPYRRLKQIMATEPKDAATWKALRSDALILAEGGNLILLRKPDKDLDAWQRYSVASRDAGGELVMAAKKKDFQGATVAYHAMLSHCNACHKQFLDGKQQLAP
ncbi:MAG: hypothetical protein ABL921_18780 [Pirellula sp.]